MNNIIEQKPTNRPRRGRPSGSNRVPLTIEERRARNAQYEKERRDEAANLLAEIAGTLGCEPGISNIDLLATTINYIVSSRDFERLDEVQQKNKELESEIAECERLLAERAAVSESRCKVPKTHSRSKRRVYLPRNRTEPIALVTKREREDSDSDESVECARSAKKQKCEDADSSFDLEAFVAAQYEALRASGAACAHHAYSDCDSMDTGSMSSGSTLSPQFDCESLDTATSSSPESHFSAEDDILSIDATDLRFGLLPDEVIHQYLK